MENETARDAFVRGENTSISFFLEVTEELGIEERLQVPNSSVSNDWYEPVNEGREGNSRFQKKKTTLMN